MELATLGLQIDSRSAPRASRDLDQFARSGEKAESAADGVAHASRLAGLSMRDMATAAAAGVAALAASAQAARALVASIQSARMFGAAVAEVNTLLGGNAEQIAILSENSRELAAIYGGSATSQAQAFYQAISAGVGDVADATTLLNQANMLAIGGVTDVTTAVGILSSAMNVYGAANLSAAEASDALFVAMRAGSTTVPELAATLGNVLPIASALGVSFDEVAASVAALTTGGIATAQAATGLRAALNAVLGPSNEAADLAEQLGINFSVAGVQANGFAAFMADVVEKTGGSAEQMRTLFSSVEAVTAVLALSGEAGGTLVEILDDMENKAGETQAAFDIMAQSFDQRLNRAMSALADIGIVLGNAILTVAVPAFEALAVVANNAETVLRAFAVAVTALAATQLPALVVSLRAATVGLTLIQAQMAASMGAVLLLSRAMAALRVAFMFLGGPVGILVGALAAAASYFLLFRDNAGEAETSAYDAAAATAALRGELDAFASTSAPQAAANAIALANDNYTLADSAYEAAAAQLALRRATLESARADYSNVTDPESGLIIGERMAESQRQYNEQLRIVTEAEQALSQAQTVRDRTARTVTGSTVVLNETLEASTVAIDTVARGSGGAARAVDDLSDASLDASETLGGPLTSAVDSVAQAFNDFVSRGFSDFKGFVDSVLDIFKSMIAEMVATAARNRIMIALGISGGAASPAMAGSGGNILSGLMGGGGGIGTLFNGLAGSGGFGGVLGGVGQGLAGVLGGGGLGSSFSSLGGLLSGSVGGAGAIGAAIPAVGLLLGGLGLARSFFGSKTTATGLTGAQGSINEFGGGSLQEWTEFKTKRRGRSSWSLQYQNSAMAGPFFESAAAIQSSIRDMAEDLGVGASAFEGFSHSFNLTFNNFTADQKAKALEAELERMGDRFAALIPNISSLNELVAVTSERYQLETRLLQLQGNTDALRARELETVHELNREMLIQIYQMEDLNAVLSQLNENDFATRLDFIRTQARVRAGILGNDFIDAPPSTPFAPVSSVGVSTPSVNPNGALIDEVRALREEVAGLRGENVLYQSMISQNTKKTATTLQVWDSDGLPAERV